MSENLDLLKSYLEGGKDGRGTHFVNKMRMGSSGGDLGEAVLHPREVPQGRRGELAVVRLLDSADVAYASEKAKQG